MSETTQQATSAAQRHIIERPRLTRLLDATSARVILLVAPAGYGKTTLARQWLANRPHAWYVPNSASADVAAVGIGLTAAAKQIKPDVGSRFRQWLHTRRGTEEPGLAADLLVADLDQWPADAWIAIDDYHCLARDAEHLVDRLRGDHDLQLLITARRPPLWRTSRELLYGELLEVGTSGLAMNRNEANEVLGDLENITAETVIAQADGWPAIIGLASFAEDAALPKGGILPPALHAYIADELYSSVDPAARDDLAQLSLLPSPSVHLAEHLLGFKSALAITEGERVGFLTREEENSFVIHPLLRAFLRRKLREHSPTHRAVLVSSAVELLIDHHSWQSAFEVIEEFELIDLLDNLISASLYDLLDHGLLETLTKFVEFGRTNNLDSVLLDLADGELAFRAGFHERSKVLAAEAGRRLSSRPDFASKAFCRAGQSAYFADEIETAIAYFSEARNLAEDLADRRWAIWGLFLCAMEEEDEAAVTLLEEFETDRAATLDDLVRVQSGRLHLGMRLGTLTQGLLGAEGVAEMVAGAKDPVVRTSFWHAYAGALRSAGAYPSALEAARNALQEISRFDLDFARAYVYVTQAGAFVGMVTYDKALDVLDEIGRVANRTNDIYLQMNEGMLRCRIQLLTGDVLDALRAMDMVWPDRGSSGQSAEFLAYRALATGMAGNTADDPLEMLRAATQRSRENEASSLCMCVRALLTLDGDTTAASETIRTAFRIAVAKRVLDPLIFAFRLDHRLSRLVQRDPALRPALSDVLKIVHGEAPSEANRLADLSTDLESLTPRERQVLPLLAEGKTNKEIAKILFLTEGTVKVHVRHILRKIGARSRTEAAIYTVRMQQQREGASASVQTPRPDQPDSPA